MALIALKEDSGRHALGKRSQRDALVTELRRAAAGDNVPDPRTALLLAMTAAHLLELVAPERDGRRRARRRIDHILDGSLSNRSAWPSTN